MLQDNPEKPGIAGYHENSLYGAGHVGTRPAIQQEHPEWRLEVHFLMFLLICMAYLCG